MYVSVTLLFLALVSPSFQSSVRKDVITIGNEGVDLVMGQFVKENMKLDDLMTEFLLGAGKLEMTEGRIYGLSSVIKVGETDIQKMDTYVKVEFYVTFPRLSIVFDHYDYRLKIGSLKGNWKDKNIENKFKLTVRMEPVDINRCKVEVERVDTIELNKRNLTDEPECKWCYKKRLMADVKKEMQEDMDILIDRSVKEFFSNSINDGNNILVMDCSFEKPLSP